MPNLGTAPAGFQQVPSASDVRFEGGEWVAVGDRHDRLGRQVDDRIDLVFAQAPFEHRAFPDVAAYHRHLLDLARTHQFTLRHPIT